MRWNNIHLILIVFGKNPICVVNKSTATLARVFGIQTCRWLWRRNFCALVEIVHFRISSLKEHLEWLRTATLPGTRVFRQFRYCTLKDQKTSWNLRGVYKNRDIHVSILVVHTLNTAIDIEMSQDESFSCCFGVVPHWLRWSTIGTRRFKATVVSLAIVQKKSWQNCRLDAFTHRDSLECRKVPTNNVTKPR